MGSVGGPSSAGLLQFHWPTATWRSRQRLSWFGDPDPRLGTGWEKGEKLAKLVAHHRTSLVLDGLEPLQNPPLRTETVRDAERCTPATGTRSDQEWA